MRKKNLKRISYLTFLLFPSLCHAQMLTASGDITIEISNVIASIPGNTGNDFTLPNSIELSTWGNVLENLLNDQYNAAANYADQLSYDLVEFTDTDNGEKYYLLKANGSNYWGTYIYYPNYCRNLVIQAPHPIKDYNTGKQAIHVFKESGSMFFMLSGTSRCNHASFSSCSGSTTVCSGSSESFRISDLAHQLATPFQSTTDTLFNRNTETYFLQLHGFAKLTSDPFIVLSNGTRVTPVNDYISVLKSNLEAQDALFVDSIKVAHFDLNWTRLIAFTNVQGRLINMSSNVCNTSATNSDGRFIHMEQEKTRLRADITGWNKVLNAVNNTFDCVPLKLEERNKGNIFTYPNPATEEVILYAEKTSFNDFQIFDITGKDLTNRVTWIKGDHTSYKLNLQQLPRGLYYLRVDGKIGKIVKE